MSGPHDGKSALRPAPDALLLQIAQYARNARVGSRLAYETARYCLMDSLACGFQALQYPACTKLLGPVVRGAQRGIECNAQLRGIGTRSDEALRRHRAPAQQRVEGVHAFAINCSTSAVLSRISDSLPRDSTFRRTSGSVFEPRRLNRHWSNSIDRPSVKSIARAALA